MRPLRFLLSLVACVVAFSILLHAGPWTSSTQQDVTVDQRSSFGAYFNWRTPSALFPPSAIISLNDDNSTFFLARPAAFGPLLPAKSLSAPLWVGSGFGEDQYGQVGVEGELGCSDIPDWDSGKYWGNPRKAQTDPGLDGRKGTKSQRAVPLEIDDLDDDVDQPDRDDGTDDHLHHPLPPSGGLHPNGEPKKGAHADIQSLQEAAEIAGKIVLLRRGGCGFLEKVKWAQRRGGVAVIVGDDVRRAPLVHMYAHGDTSNVTIPALFTTYTTAHMLSSLIPSGNVYSSASTLLESGSRGGLAKSDAEAGDKHTKINDHDRPNFTSTSSASKAAATAKPSHKKDKSTSKSSHHPKTPAAHQNTGWLGRLFGNGSSRSKLGDSRRPPSSGNIGWTPKAESESIGKDAGYGKPAKLGKSPIKTSKSSSKPTSKPESAGDSDGFVIGVQDWRDPDLVAEQKERLLQGTSSIRSSSSASPHQSPAPKNGGLSGGSITPGSGEYIKPGNEDSSPNGPGDHPKGSDDQGVKTGDSSEGWFHKWFTSGSDASQPKAASVGSAKARPNEEEHLSSQRVGHEYAQGDIDEAQHEGVWVTLTPTSMSASPFFDTLLILVVSPLVTLTVVYALLVLRSRIRRRRWRAPKSVVDRLPVRTYQTMPSTSTDSAAITTSCSNIDATTPLLPTSNRPINARPRPRSRTASEIHHQSGSGAVPEGTSITPSLDQIEEKRSSGLSEWRRLYGDKQRECVVCLEEYVDGVSRVMSLPCGHEFHADCITPWLTTRRRTCPICKGDVVRSLSRSPHYSLTLSRNTPGTAAIHSTPVTSTATPSLSRGPISADPPAYHDDPTLRREASAEADLNSARALSRSHRDEDEDDQHRSLRSNSPPRLSRSRLSDIHNDDDDSFDLERGLALARHSHVL